MINLSKWNENNQSVLVDDWLETFVEYGIEESVNASIDEGVKNYIDLCGALESALYLINREDLVDKLYV